MELPRTQEALHVLASDDRFGSGTHIESRVQTGMDGMIIGEEPFDPIYHSPYDINPGSLMEAVTGQPYVDQVLARRPLSVNVVADYGDGGDHPKITAMKQRLAMVLKTAAQNAVPSITDRVYTYAIGTGDYYEQNIDAWLDDGDEVGRAISVASLCLDGLTFVISDFRRLPLYAVEGVNLEDAMAIKANHPAELSLPANVGVIPLGHGEEINTNKTKQLERKNAELQARHLSIIHKLQQANISVIGAVYDPREAGGFQAETVDADLSNAIIAYAKNKH